MTALPARPSAALSACLLAVLAASTAGAAVAVPELPGWKLVWQDEFDGDTLDAGKWTAIDAGGGFGNGELQFYTGGPENVALRDGRLVITARREEHQGSHYTSAKLVTHGKASWTCGRFAMRAKLPVARGMWPAFWMMPEDQRYGTWPACGEIDIMELVGQKPDTVYGTLHFGAPHTMSGSSRALPAGTFADDFHVFACEWDPGEIRWYLDDVLTGTKRMWFTTAAKPWPAPFDQPFYLMINLAVGGAWPGKPPAETAFPQEMLVDWVRAWERTGTAPARAAFPVPAAGATIAACDAHSFSGAVAEACAQGGDDVGWLRSGSWLDYRLEVAAAGRYQATIDYAGTQAGALALSVDGATAAKLELPPTGGWQSWKPSATELELPAGAHLLRLAVERPGFNLYRVALTLKPVAR